MISSSSASMHESIARAIKSAPFFVLNNPLIPKGLSLEKPWIFTQKSSTDVTIELLISLRWDWEDNGGGVNVF